MSPTPEVPVGLIRDDLRAVAQRFGDRLAIEVVGHDRLTYAQWEQQANAVAGGLIDAGVRAGDRVGLVLQNRDATTFGVAYFATHKAGAVAVPINPRYADRELDHILDNAEPTLIVTAGDQVARIAASRDRVGLGAVLAWPGGAGERALDLDELRSGDDAEVVVDIGGDDLADIFYTSGTTGLPKGVASTHANAAVLDIQPLEEGGVYLHAMPLPTFTGVHGATVSPMRMAVSVHVQPRFDRERFAALIEELGANMVLMVPAHILMLLESGALEDVDTSSVWTVMFGGAPTPPDAVRELDRLFPNAMLINGYGLTEGGGSVCVLPPGAAREKPGSVGKPMGDVEVRIVTDEGVGVGTGEVGEITLNIPAGDRSYFRDEEATAQTWRDGWVHTGDLGYLDEDGFLFIVDRRKDVVIRGGYNVYSVEVEDAVHAHPAVAEVAVIGIPHDVLGQDVCVVVRAVEGVAPPTLEGLRSFLADRLADYKHPRRLVVTEQPLPRTSAHKVDKKRLAADLAHELG